MIRARIFGTRVPSGAKVELLFLHPSGSAHYDPDATRWLALAKPARRLHRGDRISFGDLGEATVVAARDDGVRELDLHLSGTFEEFLESAGRLPLPPYVKTDTARAQDGYQTIFAREPGSVAAPTASLHFSEAVLAELATRGVQIVKITLDVGLGTFRPMQGERVDEHRIHPERYAISEEAAAAIQNAKRGGRRIVAAGTTVVRALESSAQNDGVVKQGAAETNLFIQPGFDFRVVDAMLTNFHLPRSTLLVLVSAFAGRDRMRRAYEEAKARGYRFFSFGDAMFIADREARP